MPASKRVLVTGATGFIGYEVARQLAEKGYKPRLLVRRPLRANLLQSLAAEPVQGDLQSPESLQRAVRDIDAIVHLGARAIFEEYDLVSPTIVNGSIALMRAAIDEGVKQFIFSSSMLVYKSQSAEVDQNTPATSNLGYGRAKREAEAGLEELADQAQVSLAIIRLPHVYGARDLMFNQLRSGYVFFPGNGRNQFAHLHVLDSARVLIAALEKEWTGISPVADDLPTDWNEFFSEIKKYYPRFRNLGMPSWLALAGTTFLTPLRRLSRNPSLYTPDAVRGWNLNLAVKRGLLWDELGIKPIYPSIHTGIPAVMDECVQFQWLHPVLDRAG
jgi:nucleoside-diphosphate-sugar epimerase